MSKDCNRIDLKLQRKARALALQRARRHGVKRIDYQPNARAFAIIAAQLMPYVGSDSSSVIDRLILKAAGVAPELRHQSRGRVHAIDLGGSTDNDEVGRPLRASARDFDASAHEPGIINAFRTGASDFDEWPGRAASNSIPRAVCEATRRVVCGGRRRTDGQPCEALSVPGKRRCKWHGGYSTGPRTTDGKAKVARNFAKRRDTATHG